MAFTARLPDQLQHEAQELAASLGISLNALLAVALRDYIDARRGSDKARPHEPDPLDEVDTVSEDDGDVEASSTVPIITPANLQRFIETRVHKVVCKDPRLSIDADEPEVIPRKEMRAPCWCGSGKELRRCHRRRKLPTD